MNEITSRKVLKPLILVCAILATSVAVYAEVAGKIDVNRYNSTPGSSFAVTDASGGGCKKVTNSSLNSYFIPTKTTAEWDAFKGATPRLGVSLSDCYTPSWKNTTGQGNRGESCDAWLSRTGQQSPTGEVPRLTGWTGTSEPFPGQCVYVYDSTGPNVCQGGYSYFAYPNAYPATLSQTCRTQTYR